MLARFAAALQRGQIQMGTMGVGGGTAVVMDDNCLVSISLSTSRKMRLRTVLSMHYVTSENVKAPITLWAWWSYPFESESC
jgi:hypothetical protein